MKTIFCAILMVLCANSYAQISKVALKDDLLKDKDALLAKYIPRAGGKYLYRLYTMPPDEFIKKIEAFKSALSAQYANEKNAVVKELKAKDADFSARNVISWYVEFYGMDSLGVKRFHQLLETETRTDAQIDSAQKKAFLKQLSQDDKKWLTGLVERETSVNDGALFKRSAAYRIWLDEYVMKLRQTKYKADTTLGHEGDELVKIKVINREISNSFIKAYFNYKATVAVIKMVKNNAFKEEAYNNFMKMPGNLAYVEEVQQVYKNYKRMAGNGPAPDFTCSDVNGKTVSLKGLRGKYVYIDVWATWCSPCKAEIPALKKLEEELHDKNIYFVSLSVDKIIDRGKWADYVKTQQLGGIQLISDNDFKTDFVKQFNISSIPRFILIDPAGKIISGDAKRPSDPELRKQLDTLLK